MEEIKEFKVLRIIFKPSLKKIEVCTTVKYIECILKSVEYYKESKYPVFININFEKFEKVKTVGIKRIFRKHYLQALPEKRLGLHQYDFVIPSLAIEVVEDLKKNIQENLNKNFLNCIHTISIIEITKI